MLKIIFSPSGPSVQERARKAVAQFFDDIDYDPARPLMNRSDAHLRFVCLACRKPYFSTASGNTGYCPEHEGEAQQLHELQQELSVRKLQLEIQQLEQELEEADASLVS